MLLSKTCRYAVRAILYIGMRSEKNTKVRLGEIAETLDIPEHYLGKIVQILVKKHLVKSIKGPGGGFYMTDKERNRNLLNVIEAIDGLEYFTECGLGITECNSINPCPLHHQIVKLRENMIKDFGSTTIESLGEQIKKGKLFIKR